MMQDLMIVASLNASSSVRIPVDFDKRLILDGAMLSVSVVSMLSSDCARRRFVKTTADRLWNIGTEGSKVLTVDATVDVELLLATRDIVFGMTTASFSLSSSSSSVENLSTRILGCILRDRLARDEYRGGLGGDCNPACSGLCAGEM